MTSVLATAWRGNRPLTVLATAMAVVALISGIGLLADDRMLGGQPIWLKPFKFGVSFALYAITLAWLMSHLRRGKRTASAAGGIVAVTGVLEVGLIVTQAIRGRHSHFNQETPLDEAIWTSMGVVIVVLWLATAVIAALLWRDGMPDPATTWAVRLGLVLLLAGLAQGFLMVTPTAAQLEADRHEPQPLLGAHSVGVADGGPGMPLTGWSTTGGDLRVGHFVGIHALQATILVAMLLTARVRDAAQRVLIIWVFSVAYAGLLALVTWQALRGQPLTSPDGWTLGALGTIVAGVVVATARIRAAR